jgi:hypothetical protein
MPEPREELPVQFFHEKWSVECFNSAWSLMDKTERTPTEDEDMLRLSMASCWHWTQRPDCTNQHLSIGYWQISRVHSMLRRSIEARRYGELCLAVSQDTAVEPFALAYAYEALARAAAIAKTEAKKKEYLTRANAVIETIADEDTRNRLLGDLATIP